MAKQADIKLGLNQEIDTLSNSVTSILTEMSEGMSEKVHRPFTAVQQFLQYLNGQVVSPGEHQPAYLIQLPAEEKIRRLTMLTSFLEDRKTPGGISEAQYHEQLKPFLLEWKQFDEQLTGKELPKADWNYTSPYTGESSTLNATIYGYVSTELMAIAADSRPL